MKNEAMVKGKVNEDVVEQMKSSTGGAILIFPMLVRYIMSYNVVSV